MIQRNDQRFYHGSSERITMFRLSQVSSDSYWFSAAWLPVGWVEGGETPPPCCNVMDSSSTYLHQVPSLCSSPFLVLYVSTAHVLRGRLLMSFISVKYTANMIIWFFFNFIIAKKTMIFLSFHLKRSSCFLKRGSLKNALKIKDILTSEEKCLREWTTTTKTRLQRITVSLGLVACWIF